MSSMRKPLTAPEQNLLNAAQEGNLVKLRVVVWRTTNFDARDKNGNAVLHLACENAINKDDIVKYLTDRADVDVNVRNDLGETALHKLAVNGDSRAVSYLMAANANPTAKDSHGNTPAHCYINTGFRAGLDLLLDNFHKPRVLINLANSAGNTLLHVAAMQEPFLVHDLLARGGDARARNLAGQRPEDVCADAVLTKMLRASRKAAEENAEKNRWLAINELATGDAETARDQLELAQKAMAFLTPSAATPTIC